MENKLQRSFHQEFLGDGASGSEWELVVVEGEDCDLGLSSLKRRQDIRAQMPIRQLEICKLSSEKY